MTLADLLAAHPLPDQSGGKDTSGTVLVIGGPVACPGAAKLAGLAALRVGAGRVQLVVHPEVAGLVAVSFPEVLVLGWDLDGELPPPVRESLARADVVVVGSGYTHVDSEAVARVSRETDAMLVLDAGAIPSAAAGGFRNLVLAPNTTEAVELAGARSSDVEQLALMLASRLRAPIAVRGRDTAISDGTTTWYFDAAPPGLGTPGSGDVFCGVLAGMLGAGVAPVGALGWAVQLHSDAGHHLAAKTPVGYLASDLARALPHALSKQSSRAAEDGG